MPAYWFYMPLVFVWMLTGCSEAAAGWTVERTLGAAKEARAGASSSKDYRASRGDRTSAARPELKAAHHETQTTADGETRRL